MLFVSTKNFSFGKNTLWRTSTSECGSMSLHFMVELLLGLYLRFQFDRLKSIAAP